VHLQHNKCNISHRLLVGIPCQSMKRQKITVIIKATRFPIEDAGLEFFIFFNVFLCSILALFNTASSDSSLMSFSSAGSNGKVGGGLGGRGGFLNLFFFSMSPTELSQSPTFISPSDDMDSLFLAIESRHCEQQKDMW
jgi:hypothetical protein